ncbi:hypothetical protein DFR65_102519 [Oceanihabitans sediminis]|uniref:Nuclear transport factor 2 family protein n=1 Tax=Oceanihabitans sediminis TaxID=1812012 RepID=A0A368P370_9FLAO|nr:hypothetical protein [Oceanihabitans sediminis]MDX1773734.1 hypothetical protein [Oceanihabitans sediminis]RBP33179.1 hypothetical protein DFR65_102519 [Oceanihabitans sediminis]RCU57317.1 hypothetical protein DU428_05830 [Oceanihabitans sediminis]
MKTLQTTVLLLSFLLVNLFTYAQEKSLNYKEIVVENPEPEATIKILSDYVNALVYDKMETVEILLDEKYIGYGPSINDSINKKETLESWTKVHKYRTNEKVEFVSQTFRVIKGNHKGDWVSQWGTYSYMLNGKTIEMPYQLTARIKDNKIISSRIYYDNLEVAKELGYEVIPPKN